MTELKVSKTTSSMALRALLGLSAGLFVVGGAMLLFVVGSLFFSDATQIEISGHDKLFWSLCAIVAVCLIMLSINFFSAAIHARARNIVPGPTLYLLGVTLVIIALFMAVGGAWLPALVVAVAGMASMSLEYRSEFI